MLSLPSPAASPSRLQRSSSSSSSLSSMLSPPRWASRRRLSVSSLYSVSSLASSASSVSISISVSPDDDGGAQSRCLEVVHEEGSEREREQQQQQHINGIPRASSSSKPCIAAEAASSKSARGRQHQHHRRSISSSLSLLRLVRREDDVEEEENRSRNRNCRRMSSPPTPLRSAMRSPVHSPSPTTTTTTTTASSSLAGTGSAPAGAGATTPTSTSRPHTATSIASSSATGFVPRVSFDATQAAQLGSTGGGTGIEQSFTLRATTAGFVRTRESRTFLVATDLNEYSLHAMHWALDKLIEDGDELVVLRVLDPSSSSPALHATISDQAREEANMLIRSVIDRNSYIPPASGIETPTSVPLREIGITVEFVIGKVQESIQKMISVYRPDSLIVGTRGRTDSLFKSAFIGSVSKYCVANSPVPVIVVRPAIKVHKMLAKRESRQVYGDLVEASATSSASTELTRSATRLNLYKANTMPVNATSKAAENAMSGTPTGNEALLKGAPLTQTKTMS